MSPRTDIAPLARPLARAQFPLIRPIHGRIFAGVCRGIALHLGMKTWHVRLIFSIMAVFGIGFIIYAFLWFTVPSKDEAEVAAEHYSPQASQAALSYGNHSAPQSYSAINSANLNMPSKVVHTLSSAFIPSAHVSSPVQTDTQAPSQTRTAQKQQRHETSQKTNEPTLWSLIGLIAASFVGIFFIIATMMQSNIISSFIGAELFVSMFLVAVEWTFFERFTRGKLIVTLSTVGLFTLCLLFFYVRLYGYTGEEFANHFWGVFIAMITVALIAAPWLSSSSRALAKETARKQREEERADMAAHLHDSVLQTLNLIRQNATDSETVSRLARTQERELRRWLYEDRKVASDSIVSSMKLVSAQVEDTFGKQIDVITVGDAVPDEHSLALVDAARQALTNASIHGAEPISLYVEARPDALEVFVRDHGNGFDVNSIPEDRMGIRHSIQGRVERAGGSVTIVSRQGWGTEVRMKLPMVVSTATPVSSPLAPTQTPAQTSTQTVPAQVPTQTSNSRFAQPPHASVNAH
ncbi:PspC domain-containing protein [Alloscardovia venturai]|uniref:PspC domain-containing protein n=1 Tax=Alloscardovia venturai TaxID=1769421 RepID=A0ABW2Y3D2_9BIFI